MLFTLPYNQQRNAFEIEINTRYVCAHFEKRTKNKKTLPNPTVLVFKLGCGEKNFQELLVFLLNT